MDVKAIDLFKAYGENKLPREGGYIVTSFFQEKSAYAKFEIVAYSGIKSLYLTAEGLTFLTDGNKLFVLAEPGNYDKRESEPFTRAGQQQIPHRFSEVEQFIARNMTRIMISKQPVIAYSSFTICRPTTLSFSLLFYNLPDVLDSIAGYFRKTLNSEADVPASDAMETARRIVAGVRRFAIWRELEQKAASPARAAKAGPKAVAKTKPKAKPKAMAKPKPKPKAAAKARKPAMARPARKPAAKTARKPARKR
jgi:hypothetical protein